MSCRVLVTTCSLCGQAKPPPLDFNVPNYPGRTATTSQSATKLIELVIWEETLYSSAETDHDWDYVSDLSQSPEGKV